MTGKLRLGRPEPRNKIIQVRVTNSEAIEIQAEADRRGLKVADMIRVAIDQFLAPEPAAKGKRK